MHLHFEFTFNFKTFYFMNLHLQASLVNAGEEGEDDARSACPFDILGYTRDTMAHTTRCDEEILSQSFKVCLSSD
jgi:hypothetical protein